MILEVQAPTTTAAAPTASPARPATGRTSGGFVRVALATLLVGGGLVAFSTRRG